MLVELPADFDPLSHVACLTARPSSELMFITISNFMFKYNSMVTYAYLADN